MNGHDDTEILGMIVVDIKEFSGHNDVEQQQLSALVPDVLETAFDRCGLGRIWADRRYGADTGDGYQFGFDVRDIPSVVDRYVDALQEELTTRAPALRAQHTTMRMRMSLHYGPADPIETISTAAPTGRAAIDTHRLVDSDAVRAPLEASDPSVTLLSCVVSREAFDFSVRRGKTSLVPAQFVPVTSTVAKKGFEQESYLLVPAPSGKLLEYGIRGAIDAMAAKSAENVERGGATERTAIPAPVTSYSGKNVTHNEAGRDVNQSTTTSYGGKRR